VSTCHKKVLWWGRSDVNYSRNRIVRQLFTELSWEIIDFSPRISALGDIEASLIGLPSVDLVWLPCFRQRDVPAARRWANKKNIPLIFDPLISAYDKQIWERKKFSEGSKQAEKLLKWERTLLQSAEYVVADTEQHAQFYAEIMGVDVHKLVVLPVGAEESLFIPQDHGVNEPLRVLFYGSYIGLQGPDVIAKAVQVYDGAEVEWHFIGDGPLRKQVQERLAERRNVSFTDWIPYADLPNIIAQADICLGIFGFTEKTRRVIPNKVYQALSCARPVVTCLSEAYPASLRKDVDSGLFFIPAGDSDALANMIAKLAEQPELVLAARQNAGQSYQQYFSTKILKEQLSAILHNITD
tara:strand:+ start:34983 stop:36044 length:1062 start_codon:yes stop_codon:yes gene_type:complete